MLSIEKYKQEPCQGKDKGEHDKTSETFHHYIAI